eukprot:scaffold17393_cov54-Phaeocystis_antarctica.AAC.3
MTERGIRSRTTGSGAKATKKMTHNTLQGYDNGQSTRVMLTGNTHVWSVLPAGHLAVANGRDWHSRRALREDDTTVYHCQELRERVILANVDKSCTGLQKVDRRPQLPPLPKRAGAVGYSDRNLQVDQRKTGQPVTVVTEFDGAGKALKGRQVQHRSVKRVGISHAEGSLAVQIIHCVRIQQHSVDRGWGVLGPRARAPI